MAVSPSQGIFHRVPLFIGGVNGWIFARADDAAKDMAAWLMKEADYGEVVVELDRERKVATAYVCGFGDEPFNAAERAMGKCRATDGNGKYMFCDVKPHNGYDQAVARRSEEAADRLALEELAREVPDRENAAPPAEDAGDARASPAKRGRTRSRRRRAAARAEAAPATTALPPPRRPAFVDYERIWSQALAAAGDKAGCAFDRPLVHRYLDACQLQCDKEKDRRVWAYDLPARAGQSGAPKRYVAATFYRGGALNAGLDGDALVARVVDAAVAELDTAAAREHPRRRPPRPSPAERPAKFSRHVVLRVFRVGGGPAPLSGSRAAGALAASVSATLGPAGVVEAEGRKPTAFVDAGRARGGAAVAPVADAVVADAAADAPVADAAPAAAVAAEPVEPAGPVRVRAVSILAHTDGEDGDRRFLCSFASGAKEWFARANLPDVLVKAYEAEAARRVAAGKVYRVDERDADETKTCVNNLKVNQRPERHNTTAGILARPGVDAPLQHGGLRTDLRLVRVSRVDVRRRRRRAIDPVARRLKNFKDSVKYMKPGNFIFILYLLCEFRNNMKIATAAYKKARANKKRTRAADSESSDSESDY
ncbi:hypothetical protein JL722_6471 [Aureococcus anophagefferens]|nr:hypothetical protein JL722_6471 [Aureococcus anophagefferens]